MLPVKTKEEISMKRKHILGLFLAAVVAVFPIACSDRYENTSERQEPGSVDNAVSDASITTSVKLRLADDELVKARNIDVDTQNGMVSLRGVVTSENEAERAVEIAKNVEGVRTVRSFLNIEAAEAGGATNDSDLQDLGDKAEDVAELNVEVAERLEPARVAQGPCIDRIEPNVPPECLDCRFCGRVVAGHEERQSLSLHAPRVHVPSEHRIEGLDHLRRRRLLLELLGAARRESHGQSVVRGQGVGDVDDDFAVNGTPELTHHGIDCRLRHRQDDDVAPVCSVACGGRVVIDRTHVVPGPREPPRQRSANMPWAASMLAFVPAGILIQSEFRGTSRQSGCGSRAGWSGSA
jgi:hypothetical protein